MEKIHGSANAGASVGEDLGVIMLIEGVKTN
jgi:hypothetical protein